MLDLKGLQVSGSVQGRSIVGRIGAAGPVAVTGGLYDLTPPFSDPVFGTVVTALPAATVRTGIGLSYEIKNVMVSSVTRPTVPSGSFVISDHPIPGLFALVMSSGFNDLAAALKSSGGGQITVG